MHTLGKYEIDIYEEYTFTRGSADNIFSYDFEYFAESIYKPSTIFGIKILENEELLHSAVVGASGSPTSYHENAVIFEENRFLICCSHTVFCLAIPDLTLLWQTRIDSAACFEIFKHQDNYIVHGETKISYLGKNGDIIWQQNGIFYTLDGEDDFWLEKDYIVAKDVENRIYQFDYDGKSINNK